MNNSKKWESTKEGILISTKKVINEYLSSLKISKAEATIEKYLWILERFFSECSIPVHELDSEHVRIWLNDFSEGKSPKTLDLVHSCLSCFFHFCLAEEIIENLIMKKRWRPKIQKSLPKYLSEQEYARVKLAAEKLSLRNRAIILFLVSSGCRRSEITNLNIQDVDLKKRTAEVRGKGKKIRRVHFSEECALVLFDYLRTRSYEESEALFINRKGSRLLQKGIYVFINRFGQRIGIPLHPHRFRHTFATNMLARGASLEFIADELGHADLNTTRVYACIPTEDMILAYQNKMG